MKIALPLFGIILSSFFPAALQASVEGLQVDRFKLDLYSDHIVGRLWRGEEVQEKELDEIFDTVSISSKSSMTSSDGEGSKASSYASHASKIAALFKDFEEVTTEIATSRGKAGKERDSLRHFLAKILARGDKNDPNILELILNTIAEKY